MKSTRNLFQQFGDIEVLDQQIIKGIPQRIP